MSSSLGLLFTFVNLMYVVAQLVLLVVAVFFWRHYPRPSLYLAITACLEVFGSLLQTGLQALAAGPLAANGNGLFAHSFSSLIRLAIHLAAMFFLVMAVYVARRPVQGPAKDSSPEPGTPGMENGERAFSLDPMNPYSPPRQPR